MKNELIGDSLDAAKAVLLSSLATAGFSPCLVPLPSHDGFDYGLFTRCVSPSNPVQVYRSLKDHAYRNQMKAHYLEELSTWLKTEKCASIKVLVFDPDTGIRPDRDTNKFFGIKRLITFLHDHPHCVISVYQHRGTGGLSIEESLALISAEARFAYDFGGAAILFGRKEQH